MSNKQFNIILGESDELIKSLNNFEIKMAYPKWILGKSNDSIYWVINSDIERSFDFNKQFILLPKEVHYYIYVNFKSTGKFMDKVGHFLEIIKNNDNKKDLRCTIIGINYNNKIKYHTILMGEILTLCLNQNENSSNNSTIFNYSDFMSIK